MNFFIFLLCFIAVPPTFGDNLNPQNALEADRARSAWNFGGHHPVKKAAYWNRPKNVAGPGSVLVNRRMGSASMAPYRKKAQSPSQRRRQQKPYPKSSQQGRPIVKRNTNFPFPPQSSSAFPFPQSYTTPYYSNQQMSPSSSWHRSSRKLRPTVDTIKSRFMKEDLWHLDKGESYIVKDEDLERDNLLRNRKNYETTNEIDHDVNSISEDHVYLHQLEADAENMINHGEKAAKNHTENSPQHIHHHHHYEMEDNASHHSKPATHKAKPTDPNKLVQLPLPRIHNPIPLGCLLAVPVFHPIRPRHHLACLLSIPGTPSLTRRRRRRSADLTQLQIPNQGQSQNLFQQLFGSNSRMTPIVTRKHYSGHVGNGKNPSSAPQGNYKVPATIIAPPKFDKDDVLSMLLGSGGISADKMGTIVATENRYVRYGRGLPNGRGQGSRQGRNMQWMSDSNARAPPSSNNLHQSPAPAKGNPMMGSSSNYVPSVSKYPSPVKPAKKPIMHLTPPAPVHKAPSAYAPPPQKTHPPPPLILNVQISPMPAPRHASGPVITVPVPQQQHKHPHSEESHQSVTEKPQQQQQQQLPHLEQSHQPSTEQPQQKQQIQQEQEQQSNEEQQVHHQNTVEQQEQNQLTNEQQQKEQQSTLPMMQPVEPYQTLFLSPTGEAYNFDNFKYTDWMPVYLRKPKPQKAYDYSKLNSEPLESKLMYKKVKPYHYLQENVVASAGGYHESINDQLADISTSSMDPISNYYDNNVDVDFGTVGNFENNDNADLKYLLDSSVYPSSNSWMNNQVNYDNVSPKSLSYAVKKNYKDELDSVLQDISSNERDVYSKSNALFAENSNDYNAYDNDSLNSLSGGRSIVDSDNNLYSQDKYYTVKKVPDQLPDPIFISVPKENDFSNELYDVRK